MKGTPPPQRPLRLRGENSGLRTRQSIRGAGGRVLSGSADSATFSHPCSPAVPCEACVNAADLLDRSVLHGPSPVAQVRSHVTSGELKDYTDNAAIAG